jgi:hypothetical protein
MTKVIKFSASNVPGQVDIRHFFNKLVAYELQLDHDTLWYYYDGELGTAKEKLESIGFKDVKILGEAGYSEMKACLQLPKGKISKESLDRFNRNVPKEFLINE